MKHLKLYENLNEPQIGDYVLCREYPNEKEDIHMTDFERFLCNHIGQIVEPDEKYKRSWTSNRERLEYYIWVKYSKSDIKNDKNLTGEEFVKYIRPFMRKEIIHHSRNKEDLEGYLIAKKYNL